MLMTPPEMSLDASSSLHPVLRVLALPLLFAIWLYKKLVSPLLPPTCRFYPSCSVYGFTAISKHGPVKGTWLTTKRVLKCHPFHPGGYDPVPGTERPLDQVEPGEAAALTPGPVDDEPVTDTPPAS